MLFSSVPDPNPDPDPPDPDPHILSLPDPDLLVRGMDPDQAKLIRKNLDSY